MSDSVAAAGSDRLEWSRRILALFLFAAYAWFHLGFFLHRSDRATVLGLYSRAYCLGLAVLFLPYLTILPVARFCTSPGRSRRRDGRLVEISALRKVLYVAVGVLCCLMAVEIGYRVVGLDAVESRTRGEYWMPHSSLQTCRIPSTVDMRNSVRVDSNSRGFRGPELGSKAAGEFRIFTFGGSTVEQWDPLTGEDWPMMLGKHLGAAHPDRRIVVQNAGVSSYSTLHSLILYEMTVRHLAPDLVIFYHAVNDLYRSFEPPLQSVGEYRDDYGHYMGAIGPVFARAKAPTRLPRPRLKFVQHLVKLLRTDFMATWYSEVPQLRPFERHEPFTPRQFASLKPFRRNIETLLRAARADGVPVLMATQPTLLKANMLKSETRSLYINRVFCIRDGKSLSVDGYRRGMEEFNETTRAIAAATSTPLCDLEKAVPKTGEYFADGVHTRRAGLVRISEEIFAAIEAYGFLRQG